MTYPSVETALQSLEQTNDNLVEQVDGIQTRADAAVSQAETIKGETATLKDGTTAIKSETAVIASDAATSKSLAEDARDTTLGYRDETNVHLDNAAAVVTGGTATLEPEAGKIPLADAEGVIDSAWLGQYDPGIKQRREDLLKQATLSLDFANNKYEVYEGPVNSLTQMPFNTALDFTRASAATARTATGKIQDVAIDEQRLVGNREGLLIEEARTNLLLNSDTLSTQNITVTAAPYTIHFTGTGTITLSGTFTGSLVGTGTGEANRVSLTFTPTAGTLTATVTGSVVNAQLEEGSFPTSYIPTAGTQVTRAADDCYRLLGEEFNKSSFTLYFEFEELGPLSGTVTYLGLSTDDVVVDKGLLLIRKSETNLILAYRSTSNTFATISTTGALGIRKVAVSLVGSVVTFCVDGVIAGGASNARSSGITALVFGKPDYADLATGGRTLARDVQVFPTALSDAELITLTGGT